MYDANITPSIGNIRELKRGIIIAIEGIDGTGKRTQSIILEKTLLKMNFPVVLYSYPDYYSKYGKIIRKFLDNKINLSTDEQFLLYLLDMIKDKKNIEQKIKEKYIVIMDRYFLSTTAYQSANNFNYEKAKKITELLDLPIPNFIFYIEIPVEIAIYRKNKQKGDSDRFERDMAFLKRVTRNYEKMIKDNFPTSNWIKINGMKTPEIIHKKILINIERLIR